MKPELANALALEVLRALRANRPEDAQAAVPPILSCAIGAVLQNLGPIMQSFLACIAAPAPPPQSDYRPGDRARCH